MQLSSPGTIAASQQASDTRDQLSHIIQAAQEAVATIDSYLQSIPHSLQNPVYRFYVDLREEASSAAEKAQKLIAEQKGASMKSPVHNHDLPTSLWC